VDALEPFGFGHVFPRGTLREPLAGLSRAGVVMLTRADLVDASERARIGQQLRACAPAAIWVEARYAPVCLQSPSGQEQPLESLSARGIAAFCGIGNPAGFRRALVDCGYRIVAMREFADHHAYPAGDVESLARWSDGLDVAAVICTQKDLVKIADRWQGRKPLYALTSRLEITSGRAQLESALRPIAERAKNLPQRPTIR
jgi:tetraacyldisaccharide 4'-kinase